MNTQKINCLLIAAIFGTFSVQAQHVLDQVVATELLRGSTGGMAVGALQNNEQFLRQYTASVLEQELAQEAGRRGLDERLDVQRALSASRMRVLVQALQADVVRGVRGPSDEEVQEVYSRQAERFRISEAVQVDLYVLDGSDPSAEGLATGAVRRRKIDPKALEAVVHRQLASAENDGGWVAKDAFPEEIWGTLKGARAGSVHSFPLEDRVLLVKVHGQRAERQATMEEATEKLRQAMLEQRQQAVWAEFLQQRSRSIGFEN